VTEGTCLQLQPVLVYDMEFNEANSVNSTESTQTKLRDLQRRRPLTSKRERKLMDFLDANFLELTRNYKKRYVHFRESCCFEPLVKTTIILEWSKRPV